VSALVRIRVGVVVERRKAMSQWADFVWQPIAVLPDAPDTEPWTVLKHDGDRTTFYAGPAIVEFHTTETSHYRDNLAADAQLWVVLRPTEAADPAYQIACVTADPFEGESYTEAGNDIVEAVPMPDAVRDALEAFVAEHHVDQTFYKRKRDRPNIEAFGRRSRTGEDD
jgi:Protein of unknown function (DUF3305)